MFSKEQEYFSNLQADIKLGLNNLDAKENWLESYNQWRKEERNQFSSLLKINDSFNLSCAGDAYIYDKTNPSDMTGLDILCMSIFLCEHLTELSRKIFSRVRTEKNRSNKISLIDSYFRIVDNIDNCPELSGCITSLNNAAREQTVLQGKRFVDLYLCFSSLQALLRKETTESLYLIYTNWRITKKANKLEKLVDAIINYVRIYFEDYNRYPDLHLHYPTDRLPIISKLAIVSYWLECIAFHTDGIFSKYKNLKWLTPVDTMADDIVVTPQVSKFEMLTYKLCFLGDDNKTVKNKAFGFHGYTIWIKTVDIMYIFCDVCQTLNNSPEDELKQLNTRKEAMLELYDKVTKIRNYYTKTVFFHEVYYQKERKYLDSECMEALENDAELFSNSVNDVLDFVSAISDDDIEKLMQAKQNYILKLQNFTTEEQEEKLDKLTIQIVKKIKNAVNNKDNYDELYAIVSDEFQPYLASLAKFPNIFSSLVSAEFLYKQYIDGKTPRDNFDYSCISIMYYMSLEDFLNKLIYVPYANKVLSTVDMKKVKTYDRKTNTGWKNYVSDYTKFWRNGKPKDSCEIGIIGFLLANIEQIVYLQKFFSDQYQVVDYEHIKSFGESLKSKASRRNLAAHGGNYLKYQDVCEDKECIFDVVKEYRGMILELLEIIFPIK